MRHAMLYMATVYFKMRAARESNKQMPPQPTHFYLDMRMLLSAMTHKHQFNNHLKYIYFQSLRKFNQKYYLSKAAYDDE